VVRKTDAQRRDAELLKNLAEADVTVGVGVPLREDDDGSS
jgi:hypothetical protein